MKIFIVITLLLLTSICIAKEQNEFFVPNRHAVFTDFTQSVPDEIPDLSINQADQQSSNDSNEEKLNTINPNITQKNSTAQALLGKMPKILFTQKWFDLVTFLTTSILVFLLLSLIISSILLWKNGASANCVLKLFGIISIICISGILLIVGYSGEQLTPVIGLFGAIAGYLLGKDSSNPHE